MPLSQTDKDKKEKSCWRTVLPSCKNKRDHTNRSWEDTAYL